MIFRPPIYWLLEVEVEVEDKDFLFSISQYLPQEEREYVIAYFAEIVRAV